MDVKEMLQQYIQMCTKKSEQPSSEMLQELERVGNLPPQEEFYPGNSIDEELNLYERINNYQIRNNQMSVVKPQDKLIEIIKLLNQIKDVFPNIVTHISNVEQLISKLKENTYTRDQKLILNCIFTQIQSQFSKFLANLTSNQVINIKESDKQTMKNFISSTYVKQALDTKVSKKLSYQVQMAQIIGKFHQSATCCLKANKNSTLLEYKFPENVTESPQTWQAFVDQYQKLINAEQDSLIKHLQMIMGKVNIKNLEAVQMIIIEFTVILKNETIHQQLSSQIKQIISVIKSFVENYTSQTTSEKIQNIQQGAKMIADAKRQVQVIKQSNQVLGIFKSINLADEEVMKQVEAAANNKQIVIQMLQKNSSLLESLKFNQQPCMFYDAAGNQMIFNIQLDIQNTINFKNAVLQTLGMKITSLPAFLQNVFGTLQQYESSFSAFSQAKDMYNIYQGYAQQNMELFKLMSKPAAQFVEDVKKAAQSSTVTLNCSNGLDEACISKLLKIAAFVNNSVLTFNGIFKKFQNLNNLCQKNILLLQQINVIDQQSFKNVINKIRSDISKELQEQQASSDIIAQFCLFYQKEINRIIKEQFSKIGQSSNSYFNQFTVSVQLNNQIEYSPSLGHLALQLQENEEKFFQIPLQKDYWLIDNLQTEQLFTQLIDELKLNIKLPSNDELIAFLQELQTKLLKECEISVLYNQYNDALFYQQYPDIKQQEELFEKSVKYFADNQNSVETLTKMLFQYGMVLKQQKPHIIFQKVSGITCISLNLTQANKQVQNIPNSYLQVSIGAACYQSEKIATEILNETTVFSQKVENELTSAQSSQQISQIVDYFSKFQVKIDQDFNIKYQILVTSKHLIIQQQQQRETTLNLVNNAINSFAIIKDKIGNLDNTLKQKKKDMMEKFSQELHGSNGYVYQSVELVNQACSLFKKITTQQQQITQIIKDVSKQTCPGTQMFNMNGISQLKQTISDIEQVKDKSKTVFDNFSVMIIECKQFTENQNVLSQADQNKIIQLGSLNKVLEKVFGYLQTSIVKLCTLFQELFQFEWSICKSRIDIVDEILQTIENNQFLVQLNVMDCMNEKDLQSNQNFMTLLNALLAQCAGTLMHFKQLAANSINIIKLLKSPALTKTHWTEIATKMNFKNIYNYFLTYKDAGEETAVKEFQLSRIPELLRGQTIFYAVQLYAFEEKSYVAAQNGLRSIVSRAEGELSVRQAVEEIVYWQQTEAKLQFNFQDLSKLTVEEISDISEYKFIPLHANWRQILIQLSEKKAIITSVKVNPFAKAIEESIKEVESSIEALTRLALVINAISRQITVLEPVMGRSVLPNEHKKFYQAFRLLAFAMCGELKNMDQAQLKQGNSCSIQLISILQLEIPEIIKLNANQYQHKSSGVQQDNTILGVYQNIIIQFEAIQQQFGDVQNALRQYLEQKRLFFPRFYFVADSDVLEILANANTKPDHVINQHVKKLFSQIEKINFDVIKEGIFVIKSFASSEGEIIQLNQEIDINQNTAPELWLNRFDLSVKETIKQEVLQILGIQIHDKKKINQLQLNDNYEINTSYQQVKTKISPLGISDGFYQIKDIIKSLQQSADFTHSGEALAIAFNIQFTCQIDFAIFGNNGLDYEKYLTQTLERQNKMLQTFTSKLYEPEISTATFGTKEFVYQLKLKMLAADATHNISVVQQMLESPNRAWLWAKEAKCRVHKSGDVYYIGLDTFMPYTYEYQGLPQRLIHTPLTDRCFSTLITALSCEKSSNPTGPAGTGKTETVKYFSNKLGRPCIVFNCDSAIDRENLSRILIGIVLSGSVGCFDEINRLSPAVLSAISTDIENIQKAIAFRSTESNPAKLENEYLTLSDITIPITKVSPFSAVFVTMNPASREYRGRSELPFSLVKMLRPCWMGKADVSLIMQTILSTSGFLYAQEWAQKSELVYLLAQRRIPKEVHLDWGLRSLQSVLRQAALQRASITRTATVQLQNDEITQMEKAVIIKSLSDATFSRIQNKSTEIFKEILKDVFGDFQLQKQMKFGAVSQIELNLVENTSTEDERIGGLILQFYRALTAKLGVALLGKSASGKTTIRTLLKNAIEKASNNMIEIREFLITPKSMSRQDLLGFVDPVTKEWNDGALTRAARSAVSYLNNKEKPYIWSWLVFDGDIDPSWIEALNSSLDDNRLLSLSSGERIRFPMSLDPLEAYYANIKLKTDAASNNRMDFFIPTPVSFVFETDSLKHASPATVSRLAVILVSDLSVQQQMEIVEKQSQNVAQILKRLGEVVQNNLAEVSTHMLSLEDKSNNEEILRPLYSECQQIKLTQLEQFGDSLNIKVKDDLLLHPSSAKQITNKPAIQEYAIKLIQSYLSKNVHVCIVGPQQSSKFYCLQNAIQFFNKQKAVYQSVHICCTSLTTRDDVVRFLTNECVEQQKIDGTREIKPKNAEKLIVCLRNVDVVPSDEFGHSQMYTLLWSILAHKRVYLKSGQYVELCNIVFVITVNEWGGVPDRIRRLMGQVVLQQLQTAETDVIFGKFASIYNLISNLPKYNAFLQTLVQQSETIKLRGKVLNVKNFIAIPQFLTQLKQTNLSIILSINNLQLQQDQYYSLIQYFTECSMPYADGKKIIQDDLQSSTKVASQQFVSFHSENTLPTLKKILNGTDYVSAAGQMKFVNLQTKKQQIQDVINLLTKFMPGIILFKNAFEQFDPQFTLEYIKMISAIEINISMNGGCIVLSQPNNFSIECVATAIASQQKEMKFVSCDTFSNQVIKQLAERVAENKQIAVVIDTMSLIQDVQWLKFACAIASSDQIYIRSKLNLTDLRSIIAIYQEKLPADQTNQSEEQIINQFLNKLMTSLSIILFLNPENEITNEVLNIAPPLRRQYGIVSFSVSVNFNQQQQLTGNYLKVLCKKLSPENFTAIHNQITLFYQKFQANENISYNFQYQQILFLYSIFKHKWNNDMKQRQQQLKSGLGQLQTAQKEVDLLSKQAKERQDIIQKAQKEANEALVQITVKMEQVGQNKGKATAMEKELLEKEVVIRQKRDEAEKELSQVQPLIDEAKQAVSSIPNDAIAEVKSFNSPPPAVAIVLEAVVRFMGMTDTSWKGMKAFLAQNGVMRQIAALDVSSVNQKILQQVRNHVAQNAQAFEQQNIARVSRAAAPLAKWVSANLKYTEIYVKIEPLMKASEEANAKLNDLRQVLKSTKEQVIQLEKDAEDLKKSFDKKTADLLKYQSELKIIEDKRQKGDKMLNGLVKERQRWGENDKQLDNTINSITNNAMRAAAMYVLSGDRSDDVRESYCVKESRSQIKSMMYTQVFSDDCQKQGLRVSQQSLENISIINVLLEHQGFMGFVLTHVTDSTGVLDYIRNYYKNVSFISASSENLSNLIAIAARFGQTAIITDCDQGTLPAAVVPYIRYSAECYSISDQATLTSEEENGINYSLITPETIINGPVTSVKQSEINPKFRVFVISSVSLRVPSFCRAKLLELSFQPTEKSRAELYMDQVLRIWSPQTLDKINILNQKSSELRSQQEKLEEMLLNALMQSQKSSNILEDKQLLDVLEKAREQQIEITKAQEEIDKTDAELQILKDKAMSIAVVVGQCQLALDLISKINPLYITDDSAIMPILKDILRKQLKNQKEKGKIEDEMVKAVISQLKVIMYSRISNMVFTDDKIGALTIYLQIMYPDIVSEKMLQLITGQLQQSNTEKQTPFWLDKDKKEDFKLLLDVLSPKDIKQLDFDDSSWNSLQETILNAQELDEIQITRAPNPFIFALIIITFRKDLICQALAQACQQILGNKNYNPDVLQNALLLSEGLQQPIIIYTTAGQDPTNALNSHIVALAPGKEQEADEKFLNALDVIGRNLEKKDANSANIIVFKGAHLCLQWLNNLPSKLAETSLAYNNKYQQEFSFQVKVILLLEPKANFPAGLSRIAWRICLQQSLSPKNTMSTILRELSPINNPKAEMNKLYYGLFYIMSAIHTVLECRRVYCPRGVAVDPSWSQMELLTLSQTMSKLMSNSDISIKDVIIRITGFAVDAVYGVSTKDEVDLQLCKQIIELGTHKAVIQKLIEAIKGTQMQPATTVDTNLENLAESSAEFIELTKTFPTLKYIIPPFELFGKNTDEQLKNLLIDYANKQFSDKPQASQIMLRPNAMLTKGQKDSLLTASILSRTMSYSNQNSQQDLFGAILSLSQFYANDIQPVLQKLLQNKIPVTKKTAPIVEELEQQINTIQKLSAVISKDLLEAQEASENTLLASEHSKATARLVNANIMPEAWCAGFLSPPTSIAPVESPELVTLSSGTPEQFLQLLPKSLQTMFQTIKSCVEAESSNSEICIEIQHVPRPPALMEAVRRYEGLQNSLELDKVQIYATVEKVSQKYAQITFKAASIQLEGAQISEKIDFSVQQSNMGQIYLISKKPASNAIPLYVDRQREVKMPIVDQVYVKADDAAKQQICVFGVYLHLSGR